MVSTSDLTQLGSMGGIQLRAHKDKIVCNNTLDSRLELCYQEALPEIRGLLFRK